MNTLPEEELFVPGHSACPGCGEALAVRLAMKALGRNTIVCLAGGCLHSFSAQYQNSSWDIPVISILSDNAAGVASGVNLAMKRLGKDANVVVFAGDGITTDSGLSYLSGLLERGHNVTYVCLDNEAYMSLGILPGGSTPLGARTMTTSRGKTDNKKDIISIVKSHKVPYIATASISKPNDLFKKVKKGLTEKKGPSYIQIHTPCPTGWEFNSSKSVEIAKLALETHLWVNFEIIGGDIKASKVKKRPVEEYLRMQGRFKHLFESEEGEKIIKEIQEIADKNTENFL